MGATKFITTKE